MSDFRREIIFYEKYKFAAREKPPNSKRYINFAIFRPDAKKKNAAKRQ